MCGSKACMTLASSAPTVQAESVQAGQPQGPARHRHKEHGQHDLEIQVRLKLIMWKWYWWMRLQEWCPGVFLTSEVQCCSHLEPGSDDNDLHQFHWLTQVFPFWCQFSTMAIFTKIMNTIWLSCETGILAVSVLVYFPRLQAWWERRGFFR